VLAQVALGAAYRHKALGVLPHVVWALGAALIAILTASFALAQYPQVAPMKRTARWLIWLMSGQIVLGLLALWKRVATAELPHPETWMVISTVAHTAMGALVLGMTAALSIQILRNVHSAAPETAPSDQLLPTGASR
jgi:uncharacterized membrane-anchored protein